MINHIPLNQNILKAALSEIDSNKCLLLFPTRKSKNEAQKLYQTSWDFSEHEFLTMDEWKETRFTADKPILKEEKRTLAFYLSLSKESKEFFNIKNYNQSIDFSHNFFNFWEELAEEQVSHDAILEVLAAKQSAGDWQLNSFQQLLHIKQNYKNFLQQSAYTDPIFVRSQPNFRFDAEYSKIIVVNQFYFTKFEKQLLENFEDKVTILSQIPPECFDEGTLMISQDFNAEHIKSFMPNKLKIHTSTDQLEMIAQLTSMLFNTENATIIDFQFAKQSYAHLLSNQKFAIPAALSFSDTRFYRFFQSISELLDSIVWEGKPFLLSMQTVLNISTNDDLLSYFVKSPTSREEIRSFLFKLIDNDFKYLDLEYFKENEFQSEFEQLFYFLQDILQLKNIKELIEFVDSKTDLEYLLADQKDRTNLVEVLFESLADFASIEEIELVTNWKQIFPANQAVNLLKLLLDYLKPKKLKCDFDFQEKRTTITTLQDTRNLNFGNLFILNVVEGVLPDRKHTQFLLSENQRKELGLKTYEDITLRDKYYFFRLLCNSSEVTAFTRFNLEENIEVSSFLEELKLFDLAEEIESPHFPDLHQQIFDKLLVCKNFNIPSKPIRQESFFTIPLEKTDFPENKLSLSFYKWEKLKNNPFEFYLEFVADIKARNPEIGNDFSSKLIGNIAHEIITLVWKRLLELHNSNNFQHNFINNTKLYVEQAIRHYLEYNRSFKYISPHNFSNRYFQNIFLPILAEGIENFFYRLHNDLKLSDKPITAFPETNRTLEKMFFQLPDLEISLRGRPDLRIQTEEQNYIFDFKTGSVAAEKIKRFNQQLQFYEEIYYLIDFPDLLEKLNSFLFFVEQKDMKQLAKRSDLKEEITKVVEDILENGFAVLERADKYETAEITRRDLVKK
ncbi:MAG: PD-(D/E)XK nuclease family protein [Candidatus Cloacimonadales bacterium]|nr:PD-(D/E)XK nuclease family protein [Candidatus Cloacimonadales bacterium]